MSVYTIALFVHFAGLISLFGAFAIFVRGGLRMRAAQSTEQLHALIEFLVSARAMFAAGGILLLLSGVTMAFLRWRSLQPFIGVGLLALVMIPLLGGRLLGRHLQAIAGALGGSRGPIPDNVAGLLEQTSPWVALTSLNATMLGVVFVMTTKPTWLISISVVLGAAVLGALISSRVLRGQPLKRPTMAEEPEGSPN